MAGLSRLHRLRYIYMWRWRYWWFDTPAGQRARIGCLLLAAVVMTAAVLAEAIAAVRAARSAEPHQAIVWMVVWLIVALVAAVVMYLTMPKPKLADAQQVTQPTVQDGRSVLKVFGDYWIDQEFLLAWQVVGRDPIKASGGK